MVTKFAEGAAGGAGGAVGETKRGGGIRFWHDGSKGCQRMRPEKLASGQLREGVEGVGAAGDRSCLDNCALRLATFT